MLAQERGWWVHQLLRHLVILDVLLLLRLLVQAQVSLLLHVLGELSAHGLGEGGTHLRALGRRLNYVFDLSLAPELVLMAPLLRLRARDEVVRVLGAFVRQRLWVFVEVCLSVLPAARHLRDL